MTRVMTSDNRFRNFGIELLALSLPLLFAGAAGADPCADELINFQKGSDGGWVQSGLVLPEVVLGVPQGGSKFSQSLDVLSLGSGGTLTLGFLDNIIVDLPGDDFRVFENAFHNSPSVIFREAAYVEASADGTTFYRFPVTHSDGTPATPAELQANPVFDSLGLLGLAGLRPGLSHPDNGIDPRSPNAGGDGFDLATIGLSEARYIRVVDAGDSINDEGNNFPIVGQGKAGADIDTIVAVNSRETCGTCCDAVFDGVLAAQDLLTLLRVARGLETENVCGANPCQAGHCGDMDDDEDVDHDDVWLCAGRALGEDVPCPAGNCSLSVLNASTLARTGSTSASLEIPAPNSVQSGIGIVSGWKCSAGKLTATFDDGEPLEVAYGTPRRDTLNTCGDQNNAFVMLWNYSNLSDGNHALRLFDDGVEFASANFRTQTLGRKFLKTDDTPGTLEFSIANFPDPASAEGVRIAWQTASQSFGIIDRTQTRTGSRASTIQQVEIASNVAGSLEIPAPDMIMSGISLVSGWRCEAGEITASFDQGSPIPVSYGTSRRDTLSICGDEDNAYALQWNFGLLSEGPHTLELRDDGEVFASRSFSVSGLGVPFYRGARGNYKVLDFPSVGDAVRIEWSEASQSFGPVGYEPQAPPLPTPTPNACDGILRVRISVNASAPGAVLVRLFYPESLTLPSPSGVNEAQSRLETLSEPLPEIVAFSQRSDHIGIAMIDTAGVTPGPIVDIHFDCNGEKPAPQDFRCETDVANRSGSSVTASCEIDLN